MKLHQIMEPSEMERALYARNRSRANLGLLALYLAAGALALYFGYLAAVGGESADRDQWRRGQDAAMGL